MRLVIFDCDGVLVDTERIAARLNVEIGAELGWPMTEAEVVEEFMGRSTTAIADKIAARLGPAVADEWNERFMKLHVEAVDRELRPVPGVVEALDAITVPCCVASSGSHDKMRHTLGVTGLYDRFAGRIFSAFDVPNGKPAPDLFLLAARSMGAEPHDCVVVEDSRSGVEAARAAGMHCFAYAGGLTPTHQLRGPDTTVFHHMRDLPGLLAAHAQGA
jgi:HAD superfamily hydrolase (TIGR01509 family)